MDYEEMYKRVLNDKHRLLDQIQVLSDALKETQRQLGLARLANETLAKSRDRDAIEWCGEVE